MISTLLCSPARRPNKLRLAPNVSYLLVVFHVVAKTDQAGLELLGHQRAAVVLRSAKQPTTRATRQNAIRGRVAIGRSTRHAGGGVRMEVDRQDIHRHLDYVSALTNTHNLNRRPWSHLELFRKFVQVNTKNEERLMTMTSCSRCSLCRETLV